MKKRMLLVMLSALFLLSALLSCAPTPSGLCVTVLDVGQGDCMLLSFDGYHLLIDTGSAVSRDALLGELDRLDVKQLNAVLVTHPHEDHYGNVRMLMERFDVATLFLPEAQGDELAFAMLPESAARSEVEIKHLAEGDILAVGLAVCEVFCPIPDDPELNNAGLVLRVCYGESVFLLMGDAEQSAEAALLARGLDWKCDFLKVGHHGSKTACSSAFLQTCAPQIAAISCARDNDYGFPHAEVLQGLDAIGATVYRTDKQGTLRFICDGTSVTLLN